MNVWARNPSAPLWCSVERVSDSTAASACGTTWDVANEVEVHDNPPIAERCVSCVRAIEAERVIHGLRDLADKAPLFDVVMPDNRFDDGGE